MVALSRTLHALIVDDDRCVGTAVGSVLEASGHHTVYAQSREEALCIVRRFPVDFGIVDVHVRADDGLQIVGSLRAIVRGLPVIMMSGEFTPEIIGRAHDLGAHHCLEKPLDLGILRQSVRHLIEVERLRC